MVVSRPAGVAELADALDLGSSGVIRAGSIPVTRIPTNFLNLLLKYLILLGIIFECFRYADLAQLIEHLTSNEGVAGLSPAVGTSKTIDYSMVFSLPKKE